MLTMSWFPQLLCWFSMIHNIPVGTFYCRLSCEQFLMQLLEHLTETVHVANPHPPPHMRRIHISVFPASGRFCDLALGKQDHRGCLQTTTENISSFICSGYNQSEKRAGGGHGQGEGSAGNHKHSSFKKIEGGQDLSDASSESISSDGAVPSSCQQDGFPSALFQHKPQWCCPPNHRLSTKPLKCSRPQERPP